MEIKLKYYNSSLMIGFNSIREGVFDCKNDVWLKPAEHKGRFALSKETNFSSIKY